MCRRKYRRPEHGQQSLRRWVCVLCVCVLLGVCACINACLYVYVREDEEEEKAGARGRARVGGVGREGVGEKKRGECM